MINFSNRITDYIIFKISINFYKISLIDRQFLKTTAFKFFILAFIKSIHTYVHTNIFDKININFYRSGAINYSLSTIYSHHIALIITIDV